MTYNRKTPLVSKKAPKSTEADKHLRHFCDSTSRELATVLATIVGELDYALNSSNPESREKSTLVAISAAERALSLSRNLRYFSSQNDLNNHAIDLSQVLLDSVEIVEKDLELSGIKITVLAETATYVLADAQALQQVILSMLSQARRGLPRGGKITLSLRRDVKTVEVRCIDDGPGLSEAAMETLFDAYGATSNSPTELGLSVSRALIEALGGDIAVRSRLGAGTAITFHLPFDEKLERPEPFSEERRFRRVPLSLPIELFFTRGHATLSSVLTSLSVGGCYSMISGPANQHLPELNESVSVRIRYFGDEWVDVPRARIASVSWAGVHSGVGIEFLELDPRAKKLLDAIVKSHSK